MAKKPTKAVKPTKKPVKPAKTAKPVKPAAKAAKPVKSANAVKQAKPVKAVPQANIRIGMRTGEALVEAEQAWSAAEPEIVIGELDGPVGYAIANLLGNQVKGHTKVWAILNSDVQIKPATLMVSKVTVNNNKYTNILMGSVQAGIANGVLDAVRAGVIPKEKAYELGIIISVWLDPSVVDAEDLDHDVLFNVHREATFKAIKKAMNNEPTIEWLLENQTSVPHYFHQLGKDKQL